MRLIPNCSRHQKEICGISDMKHLAEMVGDLHYETLAIFLMELRHKVYQDAHNDLINGRHKLAGNLFKSSDELFTAAMFIEKGWKISEKYMNPQT